LNWLAVGRWLRKRRAKIIITAFWLPFMGPCLGTILRMVGQASHRIGLVHNMIPHEQRPGDRPFSRYFTGANDAFMTLSEAVADDVKMFSAAPVRTAPHPVYDSYGELLDKTAARAQLGLDPEQRYALFFGFIRDYKGLDLLLEAMADERLADVKLIVAGEFYGNQAKYEALIAQLGIADRLELRTEFIANEDVRYYFCAADVVVQPYKTATQSGISQLAYHFERPMIVTRVGGLPEIVPHEQAGLVVDVAAAAVADGLVRFYAEDLEEQLQRGVIKEKTRYSWSGFVKELQQLW
ncbi:MAG: glycosyltransferase, partial [Bacteroidota bacterium]